MRLDYPSKDHFNPEQLAKMSDRDTSTSPESVSSEGSQTARREDNSRGDTTIRSFYRDRLHRELNRHYARSLSVRYRNAFANNEGGNSTIHCCRLRPRSGPGSIAVNSPYPEIANLHHSHVFCGTFSLVEKDHHVYNCSRPHVVAPTAPLFPYSPRTSSSAMENALFSEQILHPSIEELHFTMDLPEPPGTSPTLELGVGMQCYARETRHRTQSEPVTSFAGVNLQNIPSRQSSALAGSLQGAPSSVCDEHGSPSNYTPGPRYNPTHSEPLALGYAGFSAQSMINLSGSTANPGGTGATLQELDQEQSSTNSTSQDDSEDTS